MCAQEISHFLQFRIETANPQRNLFADKIILLSIAPEFVMSATLLALNIGVGIPR